MPTGPVLMRSAWAGGEVQIGGGWFLDRTGKQRTAVVSNLTGSSGTRETRIIPSPHGRSRISEFVVWGSHSESQSDFLIILAVPRTVGMVWKPDQPPAPDAFQQLEDTSHFPPSPFPA